MVELENLRQLSAKIGADPLLVQAAGGNTSLKQDGLMWIKASGTWLRDATTQDIFVPLDHGGLEKALQNEDPACESCIAFVRTDLNANNLRPSIETSLHGMMAQRVVVHVHCVNTIAWAIRCDAEAKLGEKLDGFNWAFIPYERPGLPLAQAIARRLEPGIDVLVLGNHGLVVAAETVDAAEELLNRVVSALRIDPRAPNAPDLAAVTEACRDTSYEPAHFPETHALATDDITLKRCRDVVLYPDHAVFLGIGVATSMGGDAPLVALKGKGVAIRRDAKAAVEPMGRCLADVMRRVDAEAPLASLGEEEIGQLVNWDAEKYRQSLNEKRS
jgi:rhamnose utilization protein RhaD (predicted bifunctional aldolase and dehydrogenase)